jgi:hypothetical protein
MDGNEPGATQPLPELEAEDCYLDGPYLVFTAAFHLKRGFCCGSGCRHCPYGFTTAGAPTAAVVDAAPEG